MIIKIQSETHKDKMYDVDTIKMTCSCPGFVYRYKAKGYCKHITKALNDIDKNFNLNNLIDYIKQDNDAVHFVNKFGEEMLNHLKTMGDVIENKGKIIIL